MLLTGPDGEIEQLAEEPAHPLSIPPGGKQMGLVLIFCQFPAASMEHPGSDRAPGLWGRAPWLEAKSAGRWKWSSLAESKQNLFLFNEAKHRITRMRRGSSAAGGIVAADALSRREKRSIHLSICDMRQRSLSLLQLPE